MPLKERLGGRYTFLRLATSHRVMKYRTGDKVYLKGAKYIIAENYYPNGYRETNKPAYTLYPPGKKNSFGYYFWCYEDKLTPS